MKEFENTPLQDASSSKRSTFPNPESHSAALYKRAQRVMPSGTTRGQTFFPPHLIYANRASGCRVIDIDGNERVDFVNNYTVQVLGHSHPRVVDAIQRQAAFAISLHVPHESEVALAELLCARARSFERIRFANTGTEAVMHALKAARAYTGRPRIAKCEGLYHGAYDYAEVSLDSESRNWGHDRPFSVPYSRGVPTGVLADTVVIPFNDTERSLAILESQRDELAAVIIDLYPSRIAWTPVDPSFLRMLRDFTTRSGALLIFDEIISFRTHYGGAQTVYGVDPDLTTLGKIIGGGMPVAAVAGRNEFMQVFESEGGRKAQLPHSGTFTANPLSMAAGIAAMSEYTAAQVDRLGALGERCRAQLREAFSVANVAACVTGVHSLIGIYIGEGAVRDYRSMASFKTPLALSRMDRLFRELLNRGVFYGNWGLGCLSTAMTNAEIDRFAEATLDSLRALKQAGW
jgi:glutamate-1-semialdehyde 2,1-aminomutase